MVWNVSDIEAKHLKLIRFFKKHKMTITTTSLLLRQFVTNLHNGIT